MINSYSSRRISSSKLLLPLLLLVAGFRVCYNFGIMAARNIPHRSTSTSINIQWFRLMDLRLHDNPSLVKTIEFAKKDLTGILPIFCFDPRIFGNEARSEFGSIKCGPRRAKFILEGVLDLRKQLESRGSGLIVAYGKPEVEFVKILKMIDPNRDIPCRIFCQEEVCSEELLVDNAVRNAITRHNNKSNLHPVWGSTLYQHDDLPFNDGVFGMSDTFTPFRNIVEEKCQIGNPLPIPGKEELKIVDIDEIDKCSANYMPTLSDLGYNQQQIHHANTVHERGVMSFIGGETAALARCKEFIWDKDLIKVYFDTRNGLIGPDYSTKFSPWLAHGNISPRYIAKECRNYEEIRVANKSTYWVVFELLVRDYFKFFAKKHGNKIFFSGGTTTAAEKKWGSDKRHITAWKEGRTGFPFVDANMRELAETGFMSNRGRQNVCSFLAHDLNQDWRYGADYFESILLDHDVHSNWGNWCAGAGMTGGRINKFNIVKQSKDYDQYGDYVRRWLPELKDVPIDFLHQPWTMSQFHQIESNCRLGVDYPNPIVPPYNPKQGGGKGNGDNRKRGVREQKNTNNSTNRNRGRGQREDMKSLKPGQIIMKD